MIDAHLPTKEERPMRNRSWKLAGCLAMCLFAASPALSQSPPPDALAAARELLLTMRFIDQLTPVLPILAQNLTPAILHAPQVVAREFDTIVPKFVGAMRATVAP